MNDLNNDPHRNIKLIKMNKDQQNMERRLSQNQVESIPVQTPENIQPLVIDVVVEVEVNNQKKNCAVENEGKVLKNEDLKINLKRKSKPKPKPEKHPKSALSSSPSEASIISATAMEELCDLRLYYNNQLRQINYISHEHLQDSGSSMLTCIIEPLRSLRLSSSTTIARSARNLWTHVSMRRKLIQR